MYYKAKENEKIKYIDICSLYPYVCKYGKFPVGHPEVLVGHEICSKIDLENTNGLIKCDILPPTDLIHPVLPIKQNNKLMFTLCCTCSLETYQDECLHSDEERTLSGTWVIDEVVKAVKTGYKIIEIQEIWSYKVQQYNTDNCEPGLFTEMMDKFLKTKQEASGWPKDCNTEELKQNYLKQFFQQENIKLDRENIYKNPGKRSYSKLILNSFWGKFGQRENQTQTQIIKSPATFYSILTNPSKDVLHIMIINPDTVLVNWKYKTEDLDSLRTVNVCIASYTTAQARLKLYEYLENLQERVLYYDTDSVIYVSKEGEYEPPLGNFIGDMTNELESYGSDSYIKEFVSGGPKNYAYKVFSSDKQSDAVVCKVKGIKLNYNNSKLVNFEKIKEMVLLNDKAGVNILYKNFRRTNDHRVITVPESKIYRLKAEKRRFYENYSSVPFGFKRKK